MSAPVWASGGIRLGQLLEHTCPTESQKCLRNIVCGLRFYPVKAATYFKSVVPAGSCTLVQGAKIYGHLYTCISIKIEPNNQVKARWMVRRVINIKTGLMTKTAIKMRTKMTAKTMEGDNGIKTHSYHAVWGGVYPFVFLGQRQRHWHSAINEGETDSKYYGGRWQNGIARVKIHLLSRTHHCDYLVILFSRCQRKLKKKGIYAQKKDKKKNTSDAGTCLSVRSYHLRQLPQGYTPVQTTAGVCFDEGCVTTHPRS